MHTKSHVAKDQMCDKPKRKAINKPFSLFWVSTTTIKKYIIFYNKKKEKCRFQSTFQKKFSNKSSKKKKKKFIKSFKFLMDFSFQRNSQ